MQGINVANAVVAAAKGQGHNPTLFDAKELKLPLLEKPLHHYKPEQSIPAWLSDLGKKFDESDAFIVVDGEYNHGPTPVSPTPTPRARVARRLARRPVGRPLFEAMDTTLRTDNLCAPLAVRLSLANLVLRTDVSLGFFVFSLRAC